MVTIKEIAKQSGVSPMTVSNVINKKYGKVSQKTIDKVEKIIKELDYVPNLSARSLVSSNSNIIVLIIPQTLDDDPNKDHAMDNPFYGRFINSIEYNLRKNGYYMMLKFVSDDEVYHDSFKLWNADGVIVLGTDQKQFDLNLANIDIPLIMVDSYVKDHANHCTVVNDDYKGGELAAAYLLERKCENVGVVCTDISEKSVSQERYNGFSEYLERHGKALNKKNLLQGFPSYEFGLEIAQKVVELNLDGVFAFSDMIALGIIEGLKRLDKKVPEDVSIIGFDGLYITELSTPKLTSVSQNIYEKGQESVELLLKVLENKDYRENIVLPVSLLKKESVK
jgi:LacI family transcriptional regulator